MFATILLKTFPFPHPTGEFGGWFEIPNVIYIYDVDNLTDEQYKKILIHEYCHYLCWELWKVHPQDHKKCFTGKGQFMID